MTNSSYPKLPDKAMLRPDEVAQFLGVTRQTVYNWIDDGKISAKKCSKNVIRISRNSVIFFVNTTTSD